MVVKTTQKTGGTAKRHVEIDPKRYVSQSLGAKLGLIVTLTVLAIILCAVMGVAMCVAPNTFGVALAIASAVLFFIAAVLSIGAWILFGTKIDNLELAASNNAAQLQKLEYQLKRTNEILEAIYEVTYCIAGGDDVSSDESRT